MLIHWKGRSPVTNASKYVRNHLSTDLLAFSFLKDAFSCSSINFAAASGGTQPSNFTPPDPRLFCHSKNRKVVMMRRFITFILFIFCVALTPIARAQGIYTAASCNQSDVNAVINGPTHTAVDGDVIQIPAGSCTWTSGITVTSGIGITIIGTGTPNSTAATTGASASCSTTTITDDLSSGNLFTMSPTYGNSQSRISCMNLIPHTPNPGFTSPIQVVGACASGGCPNFRLDNITAAAGWAGIGISDDAFAIVVNLFGVADHDTIGAGTQADNGVDFLNVAHPSWRGVGSYGDNSWASADTFGTNQAFYAENNAIYNSLITDTDTTVGGGGGGRWVCRFNTINGISTGGGCGDHGTDTTGRPRGGRQYEVYGNTAICSNASQGCPAFGAGRSGTGIYFGNTFSDSGGGFFKNVAALDVQRRWRTSNPWGTCDGSSAWDTNDGVTHYSGIIGTVSGDYTITESGSAGWTTNQWVLNGAPYSEHDVTNGGGFEIGSSSANSLTAYNDCPPSSCIGVIAPMAGNNHQILRATVCMDQMGRGAGILLSGSTPTPSSRVNEALDPIYEVDDTMPSGSGYPTITSVTQSLIANRDYYSESTNQSAQSSPTSPFNGTSGTGHGTYANIPASCTNGTAYWATDQGSWNTSGNGGQGQLYICSGGTFPAATSPSYVPYTYPHPLIAGGSSSSDPPAPNAPTGLTAAVE